LGTQPISDAVIKIHRARKRAQRENCNALEVEKWKSVPEDSVLRTSMALPDYMQMVQVAPVSAVGEVPTTTTVAISTPKVTPLDVWLKSAKWEEIAWALGRVLFFLIMSYHEDILLGDCKAANWGMDPSARRLKVIDLGGLQMGAPVRLVDVKNEGVWFLCSCACIPDALLREAKIWWADAIAFGLSDDFAFVAQLGLPIAEPSWWRAGSLASELGVEDSAVAALESCLRTCEANVTPVDEEAHEEAEDRVEASLEMSRKSTENVVSSFDAMVATSRVEEAKALATVRAIPYTMAKKMIHRRSQYAKEGRLGELSMALLTDPLMPRQKPTQERRAKNGLTVMTRRRKKALVLSRS
jgi:hypothetical protein